MKTDPIDNIKWVNADELDSNNYNPNYVQKQELRLLEKSILENGWIQPILINPDNIIIDGFHRWYLSKESVALQHKYKGKVPVAVLDVNRSEAMAITIRINRAKGSHVAVRMSKIICELLNQHNMDIKEVADKIGANADEVELLSQENVFKVRNIKDYKYSKAWVPEERAKI